MCAEISKQVLPLTAEARMEAEAGSNAQDEAEGRLRPGSLRRHSEHHGRIDLLREEDTHSLLMRKGKNSNGCQHRRVYSR